MRSVSSWRPSAMEPVNSAMRRTLVRFKETSSFLLGAATVLVFGLIARSSAPVATAQESRAPFASSVEQRQSTVEELRKLTALVQKQNELLTSGKVKVVVVERAAEDKPDKGQRN